MIQAVWARIVAAGAILAAIAAAAWKIRQDGREAERAAQAARDAKARDTANEVERTVDRAGDSDLARLRRKWTRGG